MKNKPRIYYLQWDPALYLSKTYWLSNASDLLYRRLIDAWWINKGLPSDHKQLARYARYTDDEFNQAWPEISDHFIVDGEKLDHNKLTELLEQCHINSIVRSQAGQLGGRPKSKKSNSLTNEKQMKSHIDTDTDIDIKKKVERKKLSTGPKPEPAVRSDERSTLNFEKIEGLDLDAWQEWTAYRSKMKFKKYKTTAKAKELAKLTHEQQLACIEHSIGNQYQGLFPGKFKDVPKVSKGNGKWNDPPPRAQPPDVHGKPLQYNTPFTETEKKNAKAMIAKARQKIGTKKPKPEPQPHEEKPQPSQQSNQQPTMAQLLRAAKSCCQAWDVLEESCGRTWEQAQSDKHHKCFHCSIFEKQRNAAPAKKVKTVGDLL